jgi:hypothetical protein
VLKRKGAKEWVREDGTHFITVDLDVLSRRKLSLLVEGLGRRRVFVLHEGRWGSRYSANVELDGWNKTADQQIQGLVALIRRLPHAARRLWDDAQSRVFNIGIQAGLHPHSHELRLSGRTVREAAQVGAAIVITTYAPDAPLPVAAHAARAAQQRDEADEARDG